MKKTIDTISYLPCAYKKITKLFEKKASEGYVLKSWDIKGDVQYYSTSPRNIQYCVDFIENYSAEYIETCAFYGWEFVYSNSEFMIFSHEGTKIQPLQNDEETENYMIRRGLLKNMKKRISKQIMFYAILPLVYVFAPYGLRMDFATQSFFPELIIPVTFLCVVSYYCMLWLLLNRMQRQSNFNINTGILSKKFILLPADLIFAGGFLIDTLLTSSNVVGSILGFALITLFIFPFVYLYKSVSNF